MPLVSIRHRTTYRYRNPGAFGEHRIRFRPLESHDQRIVSAELVVTPEPELLRYVHDVFGNCIGVARFEGRSEVLSFDSRVWLNHVPQKAHHDADDRLLSGQGAPYDDHECADLAPFMERGWNAAGEVAAWARRFVRPVGDSHLVTLLSDMTHAIRGEFTYAKRLQGAPRTPGETLAARQGSCRDFAVLLMDAARSLGLAARFVSGYVYSANRGEARLGGGHTHAWAAVYLPSCGWVEFDPTNGIVGNDDLVRVASTRDPRQALPLHGTWAGLPTDYLGMDVEVDVRAEVDPAMQPAARLRVGEAR